MERPQANPPSGGGLPRTNDVDLDRAPAHHPAERKGDNPQIQAIREPAPWPAQPPALTHGHDHRVDKLLGNLFAMKLGLGWGPGRHAGAELS